MHPESLQNDLRTGQLQILWDDSARQQLDHAFLRSKCRCSACQAERLGRNAELPLVPDIRITDIQPAGTYGVQLFFSDGHRRGIFPWEYLRSFGNL